MSDYNEQLDNVIEIFNDEKGKLGKFLQEKLSTIFKDNFFDKYPDLKTIAWAQYTPYFNDGDECKFGVNSDIYINGLDPDDDEMDYYSEEEHGTRLENTKELSKFIEGFIYDIPETLLQDAFGEGLVIVYSDGRIVVEEYEHE